MASPITLPSPLMPSCLISVCVFCSISTISYGANSYLPGQTYEDDAAAVNIVDGSNPSDFFYVVDPLYYESLKIDGYNIVLQSNETVANDGSLSYFAGMKGKAYINFEAQAEYTAVGQQVVIQLDMIAAVRDMLVREDSKKKK